MRYLSVCSGIEAATSAWHELGWTPVAFSEIEPFPCAVLKHRYPDVPNLGDMKKFQQWPHYDIDLLVSGTPCQAFSVAGLRAGLADPRGNLTLTFLGLVAKYMPRFVVWENVPGVLSDRTNAFGQFLAGLGELGYGWSYRVLDAQYFGVPQRRRRVFVVGYFGDWTRAAAALFEPESLRGNPPPSRGARKEIAGTISARTQGGGGLGTDFDLAGGVQVASGRSGAGVKWPAEIAPTLNAAFGDKQGLEDQHALGGAGLFVPQPVFATSGQANAAFAVDKALTLNSTNEQPYIAGCLRTKRPGEGGVQADFTHVVPVISPALNTNSGSHHAPDTKAYVTVLKTPDLSHTLEVQTGQRNDPTHQTFIPVANSGVAHTLKAEGFDASEDGTGRGTPLVQAVAFNWNAQVDQMNFNPDATPTLTRSHEAAIGPIGMSVRRLTVVECERLQGFPDLFTAIPTKKKRKGQDLDETIAYLMSHGLTAEEAAELAGCPDGPRYKAIGNSMAVPCMKWIGQRIQAQLRPATRTLILE
jgi:DNA (cytosine-5)-methyltransferase 1